MGRALPICSCPGGAHAYRSDVFSIAPDGSETTRLTDSCRASERDPQWSPDGSAIAFARARRGRSQIFTMAPDGTNVNRLTGGRRRKGDPEWAPSGERIAFVSWLRGNRRPRGGEGRRDWAEAADAHAS